MDLEPLTWECECCEFSNAIGFERCSICGLPNVHTPEQLEKYKQALPELMRLRNKSNIVADLLQTSVQTYGPRVIPGSKLIKLISRFLKW